MSLWQLARETAFKLCGPMAGQQGSGLICASQWEDIWSSFLHLWLTWYRLGTGDLVISDTKLSAASYKPHTTQDCRLFGTRTVFYPAISFIIREWWYRLSFSSAFGVHRCVYWCYPGLERWTNSGGTQRHPLSDQTLLPECSEYEQPPSPTNL